MSTQIRHMLKENVSYKKMCIVCARRWNYFRCENKCDWDFFLFVSAASLSLAYVVFIIIIIHFHFHYLIKIPVSWLKKESVCVCSLLPDLVALYFQAAKDVHSYMNLSMSVIIDLFFFRLEMFWYPLGASSFLKIMIVSYIQWSYFGQRPLVVIWYCEHFHW